MDRFKQLAFSILIAGLCILGLNPSAVSAQTVDDFTVESFAAEYELTNEDPQGEMKIVETITVTFTADNHGIYRVIPKVYGDKDLELDILSIERDGIREPYVSSAVGNNLSVRIGDAGSTVTGEHTYVLSYVVRNVIRFYDGYDELYWDVNGNGWAQPFKSVEANVMFNGTVASTSNTPVCFTGAVGAIESSCTVAKEANSTVFKTTRTLQSNETLTLVQGFDKGYFTEESLLEKHGELLFSIPFLCILVFAVRKTIEIWKLYGKDYEKRDIVAVYYGRPKNMSVLVSSYVMENNLSPKAISAAIVDLAVRGYVLIREEKKRFGGVNHIVQLVRQPDASLTNSENYLLGELFGGVVSSEVDMDKSKNKFYATIQSLEKLVNAEAVEAGMYENAPAKTKMHGITKYLLVVLATGLVALLLPERAKIIVVFATSMSLAIVIVSMILMVKRSQQGVVLTEHLEGLKEYLSRAEKDRISMQDAVEAPLSRNVGEPVRDVAFFEKLLPFAMLFGVDKSWAKAFADIYTQPPSWYQGQSNAFTTANLASNLGSFQKSTGSSFSAAGSSGSSGFSGGSAGGGGGGGGGGGW